MKSSFPRRGSSDCGSSALADKQLVNSSQRVTLVRVRGVEVGGVGRKKESHRSPGRGKPPAIGPDVSTAAPGPRAAALAAHAELQPLRAVVVVPVRFDRPGQIPAPASPAQASGPVQVAPRSTPAQRRSKPMARRPCVMHLYYLVLPKICFVIVLQIM